MVTSLTGRTASNPTELHIFFVVKPSKAFCDVRCERDGCRSELTSKIVALVGRQALGDFIELHAERSAGPSYRKVLKCLGDSHLSNDQ